MHVWGTVDVFVESQHKQLQDAEDAQGQILVLFVHVFIMKAKNTDEIKEENVFNRQDFYSSIKMDKCPAILCPMKPLSWFSNLG